MSRQLAEQQLRARAGLPSQFLDHRSLRTAFGFDREAAIEAPGSADADPLRLSPALLEAAIAGGARLVAADAVAYAAMGAGVLVGCAGGYAIEAGHVVLATGYVMPGFVPSDLHPLASSWAIATPPQRPGTLWPESALVWEAGRHYHYARTTEDGRQVPDHPRIHAAYGYGGNGITFSFLASRMIHSLIAGGREDWFSDFAIDRRSP